MTMKNCKCQHLISKTRHRIDQQIETNEYPKKNMKTSKQAKYCVEITYTQTCRIACVYWLCINKYERTPSNNTNIH